MRHLAEIGSAYGSARLSRQRQAIAAVAAGLPGAFTIDDLAIALRRRRVRASVATLYRAIAALEESRWLERVGDRSGSALFARCPGGGRHHHHAVCGHCGRVAAVRCPGVGQVARSGRQHGFLVTRHDVTLHGLCADCRPSRDGGA